MPNSKAVQRALYRDVLVLTLPDDGIELRQFPSQLLLVGGGEGKKKKGDVQSLGR